MVSYILFDLDNTLYPSSTGLENATFARIVDFSAQFLGCSSDELIKKRAKGLKTYGTTIEWLITDYGFTDVEAYYQFIHPEGEENLLQPDPVIQAFLRSLPLPASILTNGPLEHATRVLKRLELEDIFEQLFDIRWNNFQGKPAESAFQRALEAIGRTAKETLFIDDSPSYVAGFQRLGGRAILFDENNHHTAVGLPRITRLTDLAQYLPFNTQIEEGLKYAPSI